MKYELTEKERVEREIFRLECKDHWDQRDWAKMRELRKRLAEVAKGEE